MSKNKAPVVMSESLGNHSILRTNVLLLGQPETFMSCLMCSGWMRSGELLRGTVGSSCSCIMHPQAVCRQKMKWELCEISVSILAVHVNIRP